MLVAGGHTLFYSGIYHVVFVKIIGFLINGPASLLAPTGGMWFTPLFISSTLKFRAWHIVGTQ